MDEGLEEEDEAGVGEGEGGEAGRELVLFEAGEQRRERAEGVCGVVVQSEPLGDDWGRGVRVSWGIGRGGLRRRSRSEMETGTSCSGVGSQQAMAARYSGTWRARMRLRRGGERKRLRAVWDEQRTAWRSGQARCLRRQARTGGCLRAVRRAEECW